MLTGSPHRPAALSAVGLLVLLSVARALTGAEDLTASGSSGAALRLAVPVLLAGLGGLFSERAGVVNIGLEGMMILGSWLAAWGALHFGPWWGVGLGMAGGAAGGLIHAAATTRLGVDHIVSGVAVNILGAGLTRFLSVVAYEAGTGGGGATQSPRVPGRIGGVTLPFLAGGKLFGWRSPDLLGRLENANVFLVSDIAGLAKGLGTDVSWLTVIAVVLVPASTWLLWRTPFGLRLRSVGEHPAAAHLLGVPVYRMKGMAVVISGALAGMGGAFLVLEGAGVYREGQTGGRGFIGLAALIFGNWRPAGVAAGAGVFGAADALQLRDERSVHALLLVASFAFVLVAGKAAVQGRLGRGAGFALVAAGGFLWFAGADEVPRQFIFFLPHLTTLGVLAFATQRLRPPAASGHRFRPGQPE